MVAVVVVCEVRYCGRGGAVIEKGNLICQMFGVLGLVSGAVCHRRIFKESGSG